MSFRLEALLNTGLGRERIKKRCQWWFSAKETVKIPDAIFVFHHLESRYIVFDQCYSKEPPKHSNTSYMGQIFESAGQSCPRQPWLQPKAYLFTSLTAADPICNSLP